MCLLQFVDGSFLWSFLYYVFCYFDGRNLRTSFNTFVHNRYLCVRAVKQILNELMITFGGIFLKMYLCNCHYCMDRYLYFCCLVHVLHMYSCTYKYVKLLVNTQMNGRPPFRLTKLNYSHTYACTYLSMYVHMYVCRFAHPRHTLSQQYVGYFKANA